MSYNLLRHCDNPIELSSAEAAAPRSAATLESLYPGEIRRWLIFAGLPMLAACLCVGLAFGTSFRWLYGGGIVFGPGIGVLMIIYLAITSDTNGWSVPPGGLSLRCGWRRNG